MRWVTRPLALRGTEEWYEAMFKMIDTDGNGTLDPGEIKNALTMLGEGAVTDDEVREMMAEADSDGDGFISYEEFKEAPLLQHSRKQPAHCHTRR